MPDLTPAEREILQRFTAELARALRRILKQMGASPKPADDQPTPPPTSTPRRKSKKSHDRTEPY